MRGRLRVKLRKQNCFRVESIMCLVKDQTEDTTAFIISLGSCHLWLTYS